MQVPTKTLNMVLAINKHLKVYTLGDQIYYHQQSIFYAEMFSILDLFILSRPQPNP